MLTCCNSISFTKGFAGRPFHKMFLYQCSISHGPAAEGSKPLYAQVRTFSHTWLGSTRAWVKIIKFHYINTLNTPKNTIGVNHSLTTINIYGDPCHFFWPTAQKSRRIGTSVDFKWLMQWPFLTHTVLGAWSRSVSQVVGWAILVSIQINKWFSSKLLILSHAIHGYTVVRCKPYI